MTPSSRLIFPDTGYSCLFRLRKAKAKNTRRIRRSRFDRLVYICKHRDNKNCTQTRT